MERGVPSSSRPHPVVPARPKLYKFSLKGLATLPYRLCFPPPAVGKVRSCGLTPILEVKLEDVLDRKHLPPLGLKDFEEWLLFVENCPENLYFILWLREYRDRYKQWVQNSKPQSKQQIGAYRISWAGVTTSPTLAISFARAKQTFFMPKSTHQLNVPKDVLTPFLQETTDSLAGHRVGAQSTAASRLHPDPDVFAEVEACVMAMLRQSLSHFAMASYYNVGTFRAGCGITVGSLVTLIGGAPPLAVNFAEGASRWLRFLAVPGMWLGLFIMLASLHGVCMMVYLFGDVRQLKKFELERPPISKPRLMSQQSADTMSPNSQFQPPFQPNFSNPRVLESPAHVTLSIPEPLPTRPRPTHSLSDPPLQVLAGPSSVPQHVRQPRVPSYPAHLRAHEPAVEEMESDSELESLPTASYVSEEELSVSGSEDESEPDEDIYVSPAYRHTLDESSLPELVAASPDESFVHTPTTPVRGLVDTEPLPPELKVATASFIPAYRYCCDDYWYDGTCQCDKGRARAAQQHEADLESQTTTTIAASGKLPVNWERSLESIAPFDFDGLPVVSKPVIPRKRPDFIPSAGLGTHGDECTLQEWIIRTFGCSWLRTSRRNDIASSANPMVASSSEKPASSDTAATVVAPSKLESGLSGDSKTHMVFLPIDVGDDWYSKFKKVRGTPMFGPTTRVLSPLVSRAQWEVVVRSFILAGFLSVAIVGSLVAIPPRHHHH